jgi:hypothetical protein
MSIDNEKNNQQPTLGIEVSKIEPVLQINALATNFKTSVNKFKISSSKQFDKIIHKQLFIAQGDEDFVFIEEGEVRGFSDALSKDVSEIKALDKFVKVVQFKINQISTFTAKQFEKIVFKSLFSSFSFDDNQINIENEHSKDLYDAFKIDLEERIVKPTVETISQGKNYVENFDYSIENLLKHKVHHYAIAGLVTVTVCGVSFYKNYNKHYKKLDQFTQTNKYSKIMHDFSQVTGYDVNSFQHNNIIKERAKEAFSKAEAVCNLDKADADFQIFKETAFVCGAMGSMASYGLLLSLD